MSVKVLLVRVLATLVGGGGLTAAAVLAHFLLHFDNLVAASAFVTVALCAFIIALYLALVEVD